MNRMSHTVCGLFGLRPREKNCAWSADDSFCQFSRSLAIKYGPFWKIRVEIQQLTVHFVGVPPLSSKSNLAHQSHHCPFWGVRAYIDPGPLICTRYIVPSLVDLHIDPPNSIISSHFLLSFCQTHKSGYWRGIQKYLFLSRTISV